jgi:hypothetical protein
VIVLSMDPGAEQAVGRLPAEDGDGATVVEPLA